MDDGGGWVDAGMVVIFAGLALTEVILHVPNPWAWILPFISRRSRQSRRR
jgi:hypothetical protein